MKKLLIIIAAIFSAIIISGCDTNEEIPDIYTSIYPVEFIVENIVDGELNVKSIYPRGKDVHHHELSVKDVIRISKSKLIFYIGVGLESLIEQSKESTLKDVPTISLSDGMELVEINSEHIHDGHHHGHDDNDSVFYDPHIWLDLYKMQLMTTKILNTIIDTFELTEEQKIKFEANANNLIEEFKKLDKEYFDLITGNDILNRTIMVDHDAYIYWEVRYGIERIRIRNDNESTDASPKDMIEKIELAKSKGIKHICLTKNEIASAIADQYRVQLGLDTDGFVYLHHLATITAAEEEAGMDYLSLMRYNMEVLDKALPRK